MSASSARASRGEDSLAPLLDAYQRAHGIDDAALCAHLRIDAAALARLRRTRRPLPLTVQSVLMLAQQTGVTAALLWGILHQQPEQLAQQASGGRRPRW